MNVDFIFELRIVQGYI